MRQRLFAAAPLVAAFLCFGWAAPLRAQSTVSRWLVLGPLPTAVSAFGTQSDSARLDVSRLSMSGHWPGAGDSVAWLGGARLAWTASASAEPAGGVTYLLSYLHADRWQRVRISLAGAQARRAWLDGKPLGAAPAVLSQGKHWLLVEVAGVGAGDPLVAKIEPLTPGASLTPTLDPRHILGWADLAKMRNVTAVRLSPDGARVALVLRRVDEANDGWTSHIEVLTVADGRLSADLHVSSRAASPVWSRDGRHLAFVTPTDEKGKKGSDLWVWSPGTTGARRVLRAQPGLSNVQWSPHSRWLYYTSTIHTGKGRDGPPQGSTRLLTEVWQRPASWAEKAQLYALNVAQGTRIKLAGDTLYSISAPVLSPDGRRMVFSRFVRRPLRPFGYAVLYVLDLGTLKAHKLLELDREAFGGPSGFAWSPDGGAVAFCASAKEMLRGKDPHFNVYEPALYAVRLDHPVLTDLSRHFTPAVGTGLGCRHIVWARDGRIYLPAEDGAQTVPVRTHSPVPASLAGVKLETMRFPGAAMGAWDVAAGWLVAASQTPVSPEAVYRMKLGSATAERLASPNAAVLAQVTAPAWKPWSFTDSAGYHVQGWYLTPPGFDPGARYPMIVHYYGGTLPTEETFSRRLALFASDGYVVYVLNPAGAPGYGQAFANLHINDWGYPAGSDIIEGVRKFLATHPFVDPARVGNYGHSYGGFMTMHLATRTTMFATSIALSGISNIADYWGAGYSGYSYTDGTCPGCYPWNRPDIYVKRSPLFHADRIHTPMLLIHGTADTNVVPTESEQMFTALRVQGKPVELVHMYGENHPLASHPSVARTRDELELEWFDRYLRDRPAAWAYRWRNAAPDGVGPAPAGH